MRDNYNVGRKKMTRIIEDILFFRADISPFLTHLTRDADDESAKDKLEKIIDDKKLVAGESEISDVRFGGNTLDMSIDKKKKFFGAICFTETPLNEIHCLLEIAYRNVDLLKYGLVFIKKNLQLKGVSPVLYINNEKEDKDPLFQALFSLIQSHSEEAAEILPLISVFGKKIKSPNTTPGASGDVDFQWEREWRYPSIKGDMSFCIQDIFIGLCPHDEIDYFENKLSSIDFIDPTRNMKWYATKLIDARKRLEIKNSVV